MTKSSTYSMLNVNVTVDKSPVRGFFSGDDAVTISQGADIGQMVVGADGSSIFSQSADRSATISLKLQHTSPTHRLLMQKLARQRAGRIIGFPVSVQDRNSGEGGATDQAFISQAPDDQKGANATVREWMLITGDWRPNIPKA